MAEYPIIASLGASLPEAVLHEIQERFKDRSCGPMCYFVTHQFLQEGDNGDRVCGCNHRPENHAQVPVPVVGEDVLHERSGQPGSQDHSG